MNNSDQKKRILIASVLKPVDEPRAYEKIGQSMASNGYEVFIAGATPSSKQTVDSITFIPHRVPARISLSRMAARFKILRVALRLKPDLFILSTHELLGIALIYQILTKRKIIYDVQENYFKNILCTNAFPKIMKFFVANLVRLKEIIASFFLSGFILAEKCYEQELNFVKKNFVVAENKCKVPQGFHRQPNPNFITLIFTGTLAESTGVFQSIDLAKQLHALDSKIKLEIIGFCPLPKVLQRIKNEIQPCSFISLKGGHHFFSHEEIFDAIASADFGIISYPIMQHTQNRMPTKLYEYMACGLPIVMRKNPVWEKAINENYPFILLEFANFDAGKILSLLKYQRPLQTIDEANWKSEENRLLSFLTRL